MPGTLTADLTPSVVVPAGSTVAVGMAVIAAAALDGSGTAGSSIVIETGGALVGTFETINFGNGSVSAAGSVATFIAPNSGTGTGGIVLESGGTPLGTATILNVVGLTTTEAAGIGTILLSGTNIDAALGFTPASVGALAGYQPTIAAGTSVLLGAPTAAGGAPLNYSIGPNLTLSGTTLSAIGVSQIGSLSGSIGIGAGLVESGGTLSATGTPGVASIGGATGPITLGSNLSISGQTLSASVGASGIALESGGTLLGTATTLNVVGLTTTETAGAGTISLTGTNIDVALGFTPASVTALSTETTRATGAESSLQTSINTNGAAIATETARAIAAEATKQGTIAAASGLLLGGPTIAGGAPVPITPGTNLTLSGTTLNASGGSPSIEAAGTLIGSFPTINFANGSVATTGSVATFTAPTGGSVTNYIGSLAATTALTTAGFLGVNVGGTDYKITDANFQASTGIQYRAKANPFVNIKSDGIRIYDAVTTAGSPNVSSASYTFTAADIGKQIGVATSRGYVVSDTTGTYPGPGATINGVNGPLNGVIGAVTGGAAVVYTAVGGSVINATLSGTGQYCQFGTDDSTALAALLADVAATVAVGGSGLAGGGSGTVILEGITIIAQSSTVLLPSNVSLRGQGMFSTAVVFLSAGSQNGPILYNGTVTSNVIRNANSEISGFEIDGSFGTDAVFNVQSKGISMPNSQDLRIFDMWVHDTLQTAIATDSSVRSLIARCKIDNAGRNIYYASGKGASGIGQGTGSTLPESWIICENFITNPGHYGIFFESQTSGISANTNAFVYGNTIYTTTRCGLADTSGSGAIADCGESNALIANNYLVGPTSGLTGASVNAGITVNASNISPVAGNRGRIEGNTIIGHVLGLYCNWTGGGTNASNPSVDYIIRANKITYSITYGMICKGGTTVPTDTIIFDNNDVYYCGYNGIYMFGASASAAFQDCQITNNRFKDNGNANSSSQLSAAICIGAGTFARLKIKGNTTWDTQTSKTQTWGLYITSSTTCTVIDFSQNSFGPSVTGAVSNSGTLSSGQFIDNQGYNPVGQTSPTLAASPATFTNGLYKAQLKATATTVSAVKNSITIPSPVATYFDTELQPGETVVITYTGTPVVVLDQR